jgi:hypothetical protein
MKAQRVYIDASVLGGCFDPEFARWSNALIADFRSGRLKPVISEIITAEIADAPPEVRELFDDLLVSWNFRHIVHYDKIRLFTAVNLERGYKPLTIYSPREVATDEEDNH